MLYSGLSQVNVLSEKNYPLALGTFLEISYSSLSIRYAPFALTFYNIYFFGLWHINIKIHTENKGQMEQLIPLNKVRRVRYQFVYLITVCDI